MKRILMANDLSARSDRALQRAVALANEFKAELEILTVIDEMSIDELTCQNEAIAKQALARHLALVPQANSIDIKQRVTVGLSYEEILQRAEQLDAELIVLGIHRHKTRELFRGTTAERVVRYGIRPVLVVKEPVAGPYRRVLVATDLSPHAQSAATMAARLAPNGEVYLLHAIHQQFAGFLGRKDQDSLAEEQRDGAKAGLDALIQELSSDLGEQAPRFDVLLPEGEIAVVVHSQLRKLQPDLLALGTHGRSGMAHAVLGSVAEQLLAECPIDVLIGK